MHKQLLKNSFQMILNRVLFKVCFFTILISVFYSHESSQNSLTNSSQPKFLLDTLHTSQNTNDWSILDVDHKVYSIVLPNGQTITINVNWKAINNPAGFTIPFPFPEFKQYINETIENNWIISSYIDAKNATSLYIVVSCLSGSAFSVDCHSSFTLNYLESNVSININDMTTELFSSAIRHDLVNITDKTFARFNITSAGFYLGINNNGVQTQINGIQVYFYECPVIHNALYHIPVSSAPDPIIEPIHVLIQCPTDSSNLLAITAECYANGSWAIPDSIACDCNASYGVVSQSSTYSCEACPIDTYKQSIGNTNCTVCPANSHTNGVTGETGCVCRDGFFRGVGESVMMSCGTSPSAPTNLTIERASSNSTELTLRWNEPSSLGGRDLSLLAYEVRYSRTSAPTQLTGLNQTSNREFVFTSDLLKERTAYIVGVVSLNNLNQLSGLYYSSNITVLSSFPLISYFVYDKMNTIISWIYSTNSRLDFYYFYISYTYNQTFQQYGVSNCSCTRIIYTCICSYSLMLQHFDSHLLINISFGTDYNSSLFINSYQIVSSISPPSGVESKPLVSIVISTLAVGLILLISTVICCLLFIKRVYVVNSSHKYKKHVTTKTVTQDGPFGMPYTDPSLCDDSNQIFANEIDINDIIIKEIIGRGEFGDVCRGVLKQDGNTIQVAIKTFKQEGSLQKIKKNFLYEAKLMAQFNHSNVIKLLGGVHVGNGFMIITPFMPNGSLDVYVRTNQDDISTIDQAKLAIGVASGMTYLSRIGFVHRDLAARNILLDSDMTPKIADFGLSREMEEDFYNVQTGGKIAVRWTAPEAIAYRKFSTSSDVWSFGILLWEVMSFGKEPYVGVEPTEFPDYAYHNILAQPGNCPDVMYELMCECWNKVPEDRPNFEQIRQVLSEMIDTSFGKRTKRSLRSSYQEQDNSGSVEEWLVSINLVRYVDNFHENDITRMSQVLKLTDHQITEIGISNRLHKNKILTSIRKAHSMQKISQTNLV